ncbi:MAG: GerMN domain-containing protein, partial [Thermodesulfobacteriota bacterium]
TQNGKVVLHLYFADQESMYLTAEDRVVAQQDDTKALGTVIVAALIDGPRKVLVRTIPQGTSLRAFHLVENGTAYVDLSKEIKENHPGGARTELMTIYSLVNSIVLNMPDVAAVKLLIEGQEEATLAGHIDLRYPFTANMLLIR